MRGRTPCTSAVSSATAPRPPLRTSSEQPAVLRRDAEHGCARAAEATDVVMEAAAVGHRVAAAGEPRSFLRRLENGAIWTLLEQGDARPITLRERFTGRGAPRS